MMISEPEEKKVDIYRKSEEAEMSMPTVFSSARLPPPLI